MFLAFEDPDESIQKMSGLVELSEAALEARSVEDLTSTALPLVAGLARSPSAFLYINDLLRPPPSFFHHGLPLKTARKVETACARECPRFQCPGELHPTSMPVLIAQDEIIEFVLYPVRTEKDCLILLGTVPNGDVGSHLHEIAPQVLRIMGSGVKRLTERIGFLRQINQLNTYVTVSSMLAQSLGLTELLEAILYSCLVAASAEEGSVLLLDDEKANFTFYQIEGPSKPLLKGLTFPADTGIAGAVLERQQAEVINDVQSDPRFYGKIDTQSGFKSTNMIAVPLTAGEEKVGVLEVLNRVDGGLFTEEDRLFLVMIAEEIAFAVRNAKMFELVVDSYCKQRQGQNSCKGCKRPLGSWTPCDRYREVR